MSASWRPCSARHGKHCNAYHAAMLDAYYAARDAQLARMEPITLGYATEEREYYRDVEPRVILREWFGRYARAMREDPAA